MKRHKINILTGCLVGATLIMQASVSWGYYLLQSTQIDTIDFQTTSTAGITFGAINSSVSGFINSNGSTVGTGSMTGAGSMATGVDGSSGPLPLSWSNGVDQAANVTTQVVALPAAAGSDPLASDVYLLASDETASIAGTLKTGSTAYYRQDFSIASGGLLGVSASSTVNNQWFLDLGELLPGGLYGYTSFKLWLDGILIKSLTGMHTLDTNLDTSGLDYLNTFVVDPFNVRAGQTGYLELSANNNVVPEPSTFVLLGAGVAGLAIYRRRRSA